MKNLAALVQGKIKETAFKSVGFEDELLKSGILTSILVIDLTTSLEEELNISIPFTEITAENFNSVKSIESYLLSKIN